MLCNCEPRALMHVSDRIIVKPSSHMWQSANSTAFGLTQPNNETHIHHHPSTLTLDFELKGFPQVAKEKQGIMAHRG